MGESFFKKTCVIPLLPLKDTSRMDKLVYKSTANRFTAAKRIPAIFF